MGSALLSLGPQADPIGLEWLHNANTTPEAIDAMVRLCPRAEKVVLWSPQSGALERLAGHHEPWPRLRRFTVSDFSCDELVTALRGVGSSITKLTLLAGAGSLDLQYLVTLLPELRSLFCNGVECLNIPLCRVPGVFLYPQGVFVGVGTSPRIARGLLRSPAIPCLSVWLRRPQAGTVLNLATWGVRRWTLEEFSCDELMIALQEVDSYSATSLVLTRGTGTLDLARLQRNCPTLQVLECVEMVCTAAGINQGRARLDSLEKVRLVRSTTEYDLVLDLARRASCLRHLTVKSPGPFQLGDDDVAALCGEGCLEYLWLEVREDSPLQLTTAGVLDLVQRSPRMTTLVLLGVVDADDDQLMELSRSCRGLPRADQLRWKRVKFR